MQTDDTQTTDWQTIDTAPKSGIVPILLWFPWDDVDNPAHGGAHGAMYIGVWGWNDKSGALCWIDDSDAEALGDPTYWMPLPDPPEDVHGR
jgi:hypothetical protein